MDTFMNMVVLRERKVRIIAQVDKHWTSRRFGDLKQIDDASE